MHPYPNVVTKAITVAGREMTFETGRLAQQAGGAVLARHGDTVVLVTATLSKNPREGLDFFPLTVDYEERLYAVGRIPGGFIKREGRPTEKAILSARLIDRPIRPLFPKQFRRDVHVVVTVLSVDQDNPPDILAINGASAALRLCGVPFNGPIAAVSLGLNNQQLVINPILADYETSNLHLVVAGTEDAVMMVEAAAAEVQEDVMLGAIMMGHAEIQRIVQFINEFHQEALEQGIARTPEQFEPAPEAIDSAMISEHCMPRLRERIEHLADSGVKKAVREAAIDELKKVLVAELVEKWQYELESSPSLIKQIVGGVEKVEKQLVRRMAVLEQRRVDGRGLQDIRPIVCEVGITPRTHGSGLFTRGETQVLTIATLGAVGDEQILDGLGVEESKRYMHHYNFPPFSVGETRPMRGPGRREIGHGALAERALVAVLPSEEDFPYTIRVVSEVIASNGSTSMGSVCGSTLALLDAGVPINRPVAGVAMGLVKEADQVAILTDIQGIEDALGDMDFKVAGTDRGITALQMDIKIAGLGRSILEQALAQALTGRMHILGIIREAMPVPRAEMSPFAPRIIRMIIDTEKIRDIIGPGGKIIKKIIEETGVKIDIEDDGRVFIAATDGEGAQKAIAVINAITQDVKVGQIYQGRVTRTMDFGAFVEIIPGVLGLPGKEGMVHISQLADTRVAKVEDVVREGDQVLVKAIGFDPQGRLRLSRKEALPRETNPEPQQLKQP